MSVEVRKDAEAQPAVIEAVLGELPQVKEAFVMVRKYEPDGWQVVAYVVPDGPFDPQRLHAELASRLPKCVLPAAFVPVSSLPLTATGEVDEQALARLGVIDSGVVTEVEERLRAVPGISEVAVVVEEHVEAVPPLHLSDLVPGWKSAPARDGSERRTTPVQVQGARNRTASGALAVSDGGPLQQDADAPATLPHALKRAVRVSPEKGVVYIEPDETEIFQPYPALLEDAERILGGLRKLGLKPQDKIIFQLERNQNFIPAFWACQLGGFVPVPISIAPNYTSADGPAGKLISAWRMLDCPVTLTDAALVPAIRALSDGLETEKPRIAAVEELRLCEPDHVWRDSKPNELCLLLLTSGSTGVPKAVALSHRNLISFSAGTAQMNRFSSAEVSLNWFPMDHVGALVLPNVMCVYLGCQQIHAQKDVVLQDPLKWLEWIDRHRATITWAPNFAFGLINDRADKIEKRNWDLSSMQFLINAGEAIVAGTARHFLRLLARHGLPGTSIHPAFGMSETCSGITWSDGFSLDSISDDDLFVELGPPIPGASLRIVDENNEPVEEGTVGRLQVRGDSVTSGYYRNPGRNEEAFTPDGWFKTGDLGFLRGGRLTITGREKDVIIVNGVNYHGHEIEAVVEQIPGVVVSYTAACAVREPGADTDKLAIFFHSSSANDDFVTGLLKAIRGTVVSKIGVNPDYLIPVATTDIPKTEIGKIQRTQLAQRFKAGGFDAVVRRVDILSGNANTLPAWFYSKVWRRKQRGTLDGPSGTQSVLVFLDRSGLGVSLRNELNRRNWPSVGVEAGPDFARLASNLYRIDPRNPEHYRRLLASVAADGLGMGQIAHLWTYDASASGVAGAEELELGQDLGVFSLLFLVQALAQRQGDAQPVRLNVISCLAQHVLPEDEVAYQNGPLFGLVRTVSQEIPWLDCRHLDLTADDAAANATHIVGEMLTTWRDREVAYRQCERWIPRLQRMDFVGREKREPPFRRGGMYLLSGGLGGIGAEIASFLLKEFDAKLLLVGRTALPPAGASNTGDEQAIVSERIKILRELEQLPGEVRYEAVDICDMNGLQQAVRRASNRWKRELDGVIHLAGVYQERPLAEETRETLASVLRPKVLGTWALSQLLKDEPDKIFVSFSSMSSHFGGALVGAYSAANSFLDCFTQHERRNRSTRSYCLEWSTWDDVGMSRSNSMRELMHSRGYHAIPSRQGLHSLLAVLCQHQAHVLVGLDGNNERVRKQTDENPCRTRKLCAYLAPKAGGIPGEQLRELSIRDRFGTRIGCEFQQVSQLPRIDTGAIDRDRLARLRRRPDQAVMDFVAPRTKVERRIAGFWREVLATPKLSVHDNFFELGGNSLLATQVASRVQEAYGVQLPLRRMLEESTVAKLALAVERHLDQLPTRDMNVIEKIATEDAKSILAKIDQLSDEEVSTLLSKTLADSELR